MRDRGLVDAMPVFHQDEDERHLRRYVDLGATYIGISPATYRGSNQVLNWLEWVFCRIDTNAIQTHGFGVTNLTALKRFPFATCDSATWIKLGANGSIFMPKYRDGAPDYTARPIILAVSKARSGRHLDSEGTLVRRNFEHWVTEVGTTAGAVRTRHTDRILCNAHFLRRYAGPMLIFAINDTAAHNDILNRLGINRRLASYFWLQNQRPSFLPNLVLRGVP